VFDAEDDLRGLLRRPGATYAQMERAAVLAGDPADAPGQATVPKGAWCLHPRGYLVAYLPEGYTRTVVTVHVPRAVHWQRDANGRLALLATADGQRLQVLYDDREAPAGGDRPGGAAHAYRALRLRVPDATRPGRLRELLLEQAGRVMRRRAEAPAPAFMLAADLGAVPAGPDAANGLADLCGRLRAHGAAPADLGAATDLWYLRDSLRSAVAPHGLASLLDDALVRACLGLPVPPAAAGTPGGNQGGGTPGGGGANNPGGGGTPGGNQGTPGGNQGGGTPGGEGANNPGGGGTPGGNQGTPGGNQGGGTPGGEGANNPGGGGTPGGNQGGGTPGGDQGGGTPGGEGTNNPGGGGTPDGNQGGNHGGGTPGGEGTNHPDGGGAPDGNHGGQPNGGGGGAPDGGGANHPDGGGAPNGNHGGTSNGGGGKPHGGQGGQQHGGSGGDWSGTVDFDPTDGAAVPGHVGRQRLGVSARPSHGNGHQGRSGRRDTPRPDSTERRGTPDGANSGPPNAENGRGGSNAGQQPGGATPAGRSAKRGWSGLVGRLARWWAGC